MSQIVEASVDNRGCIRIPAEVRDRMGLSPGMRLIVEEGERGRICLRIPEESPVLVEKEGVLVVRAEGTGDIGDAVRRERGRRLSEIFERTGL